MKIKKRHLKYLIEKYLFEEKDEKVEEPDNAVDAFKALSDEKEIKISQDLLDNLSLQGNLPSIKDKVFNKDNIPGNLGREIKRKSEAQYQKTKQV